MAVLMYNEIIQWKRKVNVKNTQNKSLKKQISRKVMESSSENKRERKR